MKRTVATAACSSTAALVLTLLLSSAAVASTMSENDLSAADAENLSSDIISSSSSSSSTRPPRREHRPASSSSSRPRRSAKTATVADENTCTLYLAPTYTETQDQSLVDQYSISMGVYAGVDLPPNTPLGHTDMVIPIIEIWSHIMHRHFQTKTSIENGSTDSNGDAELQTRDALDVLSTGHHGMDYHMASLLWEPHHLGGAVTAGHGYDAKALSPGLGSLIRSASFSIGDKSQDANGSSNQTEDVQEAEANVRHGRVHSEREGVHRTDPTAGSFTYYHGLATYTTTAIEAGSELYADFGDHYYASNGGNAGRGSTIGTSPPSIAGNNSNEDGSATTIPAIENKSGNILSSLWGVVQDSAIGSALPNVLQKVVEDSNNANVDTIVPEALDVTPSMSTVARPSTHHTPQWLGENGRCLDTIRPARSTIPGAGRGAFANRHIAAGEVIAPAPMVHITDRTLLDIREPLPPSVLGDKMESAVLSDTVVGKQLLLNYCMGHNSSTMLLCSVGAGTTYINHASEPNAELRWSTRSGLHNATWLERTPDELDGEQSLGMMMEYVATRPIMPGEEIFVNYGNEWEDAWEQHLTAWNPDPDAKTYVDASMLNKVFSGMSLLTLSEQTQTPFPRNIQTSCYYHYVPEEDMISKDMEQGGIVMKQWVPGMGSDGSNLRSCRILQRHGHENGVEDYTVRVLNNDETHHSARVPDEMRLIVTNVPRDAIVFTNRMYTTDQHLSSAFRHEAMIPDDLMPEAWKNLQF